jgi:hypothetical protein
MNWLSDHNIEVLGYVCMLAAFLHSGTDIAVYVVGGILCWGIQELLDQMRGEKDE